MISKLCAYGKDREATRHRLSEALDSYAIDGVRHNVPFVRAVLEHPEFISGEASTKFIETEFPESEGGFKGAPLTDRARRQLACAALAIHLRRSDGMTGDVDLRELVVT